MTNKCKYINNNNILAHYLPITFRPTWFYFETYVYLQYVKSTVQMDVCLRDNLILFRCFAKTSKVNLQLPIVILKKIGYSDMHHRIMYMYINFHQTRVSRSVQTVHTNIFANNPKLHKFATTTSNFEKIDYLDMHHRITYMYINF